MYVISIDDVVLSFGKVVVMVVLVDGVPVLEGDVSFGVVVVIFVVVDGVPVPETGVGCKREGYTHRGKMNSLWMEKEYNCSFNLRRE